MLRFWRNKNTLNSEELWTQRSANYFEVFHWEQIVDHHHYGVILVETWPVSDYRVSETPPLLKYRYSQGIPSDPSFEDDIPEAAITTRFGLFEYIFMTFELRNASQTFDRRATSTTFFGTKPRLHASTISL